MLAQISFLIIPQFCALDSHYGVDVLNLWEEILESHERAHNNEPLQCHICNYKTPRKDNLTRHLRTYHHVEINPINLFTEKNTSSPCDSATHGGETKAFSKPTIDDILTENEKWIKDYERVTDRYQDQYNFEITHPTTQKLMKFVQNIFSKQTYAFKINLSFGYVLYNTLTEEHEWYYPSMNNRIFQNPFTITHQADIATLADALENEDILEYCKNQRKNSRYVVERVTNALFHVNKMKPFTIGCGVELPAFITNKKAIIGLAKDKYGRRYMDNLCLFRCIAYHRDKNRCNAVAQQLADEYFENRRINRQKFRGITVKELQSVESLFQVNIEVYELEQETNSDGNAQVVALKVHSSRKIHETTINVNLYLNHFSYIQNLNKYSRQWSCRKCRKLFCRSYNLEVHQRHCLEATSFEYPGGGYGPPKSLFDLLRENGCSVDEYMEFYPHRITFDFEAMCQPLAVTDPDAKLQYKSVLIPASVSVCSNVESYEVPRCFVSDGNVDSLIDQMYNYIMDISVRSFQILMYKYEDIILWIQEKQEEISELRNELAGISDDDDSSRQNELVDQIYRGQIYQDLGQRLEKWLRQIPVLGFNCGRFDVNLVRQYMFPYMLQKGVAPSHIIKKANDYLSISTDDFVILDMKNFLSPGTSYAKFLQSMDVQARKGFWPYDWFQNLEQLDTDHLIPKECFWSELKQEGISDSDYEYLQKMWETEKFETMRDHLISYNNMDTLPFIEAAQKFHDHWRELGIDAYKSSSISLPGLALQLMTRRMQNHTIVPLIRDSEQFNLIKDNIVGGLSVVMHRYHRTDVTTLPNGKPVKKIYSFDANSLYLYALAQDMGTGIYATWTPHSSTGKDSLEWKRGADKAREMRWHDIKQTNDELVFCRRSSYPKMQSQTEWLEYLAYERQTNIDHKFNGREKVIRVSTKIHFPVDGYQSSTNCVLQFNGCYWHGHGCSLDSEKDPYKRKTRYDVTVQNEQKIRNLGYNLETIWECQWVDQRKKNPAIDQFLEENLRLKTKKNVLTAKEILQRVQSGDMFGIVECDVEVPFFNEELLAYFDEFPPIYKNTNIGLSDIQGLMKRHAIESNLLQKPRRCMVNSFWAKKICITTPLLQWYLQHGLQVTRVYQVLEMKSKRCFNELKDEIANHRRKGDIDARYKATGENWKLVGNSCYGKSVTNKLTHKQTILARDENVVKYINDRRFSKMEEVGDLAYEVCMDKRKISQNLPITIGFFVYNASKLRMLEFIYGFLKKYLRPGSYQMICSDTDSIIAAYEDPDIDKLVKEEMQEEYFSHGKKDFLVVDEHGLREPGLFKIEKAADTAVALCSKTYYLFDDTDQTAKMSTKGLSKKNNFKKEDFMKVLRTRMSGSGINRGMRLHGRDMVQYEQEKSGLSYFYIKRHVKDDGISTRALDI